MGHSVTIGGERLGSGKKMKAYLHNYERSTHDMGYVWRSTMAAGTLVPFLVEVALPGDTFDINLQAEVLTHPTIGPLFGHYKVQLDIFEAPMRLYQGKLHMNMLGIGMDMAKVALPQVQIDAPGIDSSYAPDNQQINPSSIWSYLNIRGIGVNQTDTGLAVFRRFNAIPYLAYWDIYKNYYANKQEEIGAVIHRDTTPYAPGVTAVGLTNVYNATTGTGGNFVIPAAPGPAHPWPRVLSNDYSTIYVQGTNITDLFDPSSLVIYVQDPDTSTGTGQRPVIASDLFDIWEIIPELNQAIGTSPNRTTWGTNGLHLGYNEYIPDLNDEQNTEPQIVTFPLNNIDAMRQNLLTHTIDAPYIINQTAIAPYGLAMKKETQSGGTTQKFSQTFPQEGLALKTYQSDLFNNWISTEWIDGPDGISAITAVDVSGGTLQIDELNMSRKVYDMLNRIAISGGSYDDWLDAVYTQDRQRAIESPMYLGGAMRQLVFQEVISQAETPDKPLGTLAGRGRLGGEQKGGHIIAKVSEPSYLIGIVSITPIIDYSQGNKWDVNLKTLDDLHKPALDEIGFQDLITDQQAWFDTKYDNVTGEITFRSAGKQPAWLNYMTNVNQVKGNFADQNQQMYMVLSRRYEISFGAQAADTTIKDLTTYIDPTKFNHIFADTRRDAQNFWTQIGVDMIARRKMSAKIMPNL